LFCLQSSLWFYLEDISVGYAYPQMPNTLAVGDIMAGRPGKPLPPELESFMSASSDGVILVSFGSYLDFVPPDVARKFCDAFTDRRNRLRVIWKMRDEELCPGGRDGRLKLMRWVPQNDLLADARVQLFISHGGLSSIVESVYHAKPLIIFPIAFDQPTNAAAAESKGFAIRMNIGDLSPQALLTNVDKLLDDPSYKRNALLASAILRDRPHTAAQLFFMFDIFAVLLAAGVVVLLAVVLTCRCVYRTCCRRCCATKKPKTA